MIKNLWQKHQREINYLLVGFWNTLFGYSVFLVLYFLFASRVHYLLIWLVSSILAITNAYLGYKVFVFKTKGNYWREYMRFYIVYGTSMALNLVALPLCVELFKLSPPVVQAGWMIVNVTFSYIGHKNFSFKQSAVKKSATGT